MVRRILAGRRLTAGEDHDLVEMCYTSGDFREGRGRVPGEARAQMDRELRASVVITMNVAALSVAALVLAIIVSCVTSLNVGVLAIALAWIVGVYIGGMPVNTVMAGFPGQLFLTLAGVTLLFTLAQWQRHARPAGAPRRAVVPRQPRRDADHVLRPRGGAGLDGPGQHRHRGAHGADGDGDGRPHRPSRCS